MKRRVVAVLTVLAISLGGYGFKIYQEPPTSTSLACCDIEWGVDRPDYSHP